MILTFTRLADPVVEANGHQADSEFTRTFWLPILGPTSTLLLAHIARRLDEPPYVEDADVLAQHFGVSGATRSSPLHRSLVRLAAFGMAHPVDESMWAVRTHVDWVPASRLKRLPLELQRQHLALLADENRQLRAAS